MKNSNSWFELGSGEGPRPAKEGDLPIFLITLGREILGLMSRPETYLDVRLMTKDEGNPAKRGTDGRYSAA